MGFKLVERVYSLDRNATSPSEQAVLLALAYRANDKNLLCYPKQETLVQMTHLSRSTVAMALNGLRKRGLLSWKSGGLAHKKGNYGRPLANDYTLMLPPVQAKRKLSTSVANIEPSDQQSDTPVSDSKTHLCPTIRHTSVRQSDTGVSGSKTPTEETTKTTTGIGIDGFGNNDAAATEPGLDLIARDLGRTMSARTGAPTKRNIESSPLHLALHICGLSHDSPEYLDNYRAFSFAMMKCGMARSMEIIREINSELQQGELDGIRSLPRFIMSRLQAES